MSEDKITIFRAFASAQAEFATVKQTAENPFFKSKYAELSAYVEMIRPILKEHGFAVSQSTKTDEGGISVKTVLYHESGELIESEWLTLHLDKNTAQGAGSAITYARRYSLTAFLGLVSEGEDDDGNAASEGSPGKKAPTKESAPPSQASQPSVDGNLPPLEKGDISVAQVGKVNAMLYKLGIEGDERKEKVSQILGYTEPIASFNNLTKSLVKDVFTRLQEEIDSMPSEQPEQGSIPGEESGVEPF